MIGYFFWLSAVFERLLAAACFIIAHTVHPPKRAWANSSFQHPNDFQIRKSDNLHVKILLLELGIMRKDRG